MRSLLLVVLSAVCLLLGASLAVGDQEDKLKLLEAENQALRAQVARLTAQLTALRAAPSSQPVAATSPKLAPASLPVEDAWLRPVITTLKFPTGQLAANYTDAQWQNALADLKGAELIGQMEVGEVVKVGASYAVLCCQIETIPQGYLTRSGVIYFVRISSKKEGVLALKKADGLLFYGKVTSTELKPVTRSRIGDSLLNGYEITIAVDEINSYRGSLPVDPNKYRNPKAAATQKELARLRAEKTSIQKRLSVEKGRRPVSKKALDSLIEAEADVTTRECDLALRSRINELKWQLLGPQD
jgi:outer membrane murein-binding lipoprotein Lpp